MSIAELIREFDWSTTGLGPIERWPQSLKTITSFLELSPVPIVLLWGIDGIMVYNDAYSIFAGGRHPKLLGSKVREGWPEVAAFNDNVMRVGLAGGTLTYKDQELILNRTGIPETVWLDLNYSPVIDESGSPGGVIAVVVETTGQVLANRRITAEREQLAQMFEQAPTFMAMLRGPEHRIERANPGYVALTGHRAILGRTVVEALPDAAAQGYVKVLDEVFRSGEPFKAVGARYSVQADPGGPIREHFLDFVYQPLKDASGAVVGIFVEGADVTERAAADAALRESEARLLRLNADLERQVIERTQARGRTWQVSPDLMGSLNFEGILETYNPAWRKRLGWSDEELAHASIFDLVHPDDVVSARRGFEQTTLGHPSVGEVNRYRCKDGSYRWLSWVSVPDEGKIYCSGRDVTPEKVAEAELAQAQEALRQSQKMEAIGQLTGGIAHDFNNLLMGISGNLEMIEDRISKGRASEVTRYVGMAQKSARRAAAMTQRLLAFSRRQTLDPKPIDLNRMVAGMEDLIRRTVGPSVAIEVVGAGGLWLTKVDPPQLENALLNLAINARDAMPDGGRITIETANKWLDERGARDHNVTEGQYVTLCVTDTGTGMTPEVIDRAFDPFFTTKPLGQGTGLGLSMIHGFVRQSGGEVRIYSELGKGTTMCLYLPRYRGEMDAIEPMDEHAELETADGERILVVDDEESIRMLIAELLEESGYRVVTAEDGPAGLKILASDVRVDLLITDVGLPGGFNGRQVADAARVSRPTLKVLFITGYAENAVVGNGHLEPGMQLITKPFSMAALSARVKAILKD